ncbi:hypothetical protein ACJMK2_004555 [Sinanodonta woodiana]|uniref:Uncharacterized protein n=1 Tax=Sinanodonta woodiana TaxID=1069815 RepID=A0ABD3Y3G0_SINWO
MASACVESISKEGPVCPICLDVFTSPRQLPCMHSFCQKCLQDYISKSTGNKETFGNGIVCPVCRATSNPPITQKPIGEWASLYPQSPSLAIEGPKVKAERYCNGCQYVGESNTALGFCVVCEESLCNACLTAHKRTKSTRGHNVISIEELTSAPEHHVRFSEGFGCPDHQEKRIEYYCQSHETVCCADCFFSDHRTCDQVKSLSKDLPSLLSDLMPEEIMKQMKKIEKHLRTFITTNESNISKLDTAINKITAEIRTIRKIVNEKLDEIERMVTTEGNRICKEEMIGRQEENHQCQCLINAVRNSHLLLESVLKHGTDTQKFLVCKKLIAQLESYTVQIREKYEEIKFVGVQLEIGDFVKEILSSDICKIAKLQLKEDRKSFLCSGISESLAVSITRKPSRERVIKLANIFNLECKEQKTAFYTGGVWFPDGHILLADFSNRACFLFDSTYKVITSFSLTSNPCSMCFLHDHEVAVTLPDLKTVQFLSVRDSAIRDAGQVQTKYRCFGVSAISINEVVVTGGTNVRDKCYWSLVSRTAGERCHSEFDCPLVTGAHVTLNNRKSRVYISVEMNNSLYCFGLRDAKQYFVYSSRELQCPLGVAVDNEDNVYVVGCRSNNIHKLSPEGITLQVITSGVPRRPLRIFFEKSREYFMVTNDSGNQNKKLYLFAHQGNATS